MATHDLSRLMKWMAQDPWRVLLEETLAEHFEPTMTTFDLEFEEIDDALGGGFAGTLWGLAFEDALSRRTDNDESPIEAYLQRRGWTESPGSRRYIAALKDAVLSLYEVSEPNPGQSFLARDLLRGGDPVEVLDRTASRTLQPWDRIAARLVPHGKGYALSGALLAFSPGACDLLARALDDLSGTRRRRRKAGGPPPLAWPGSEERLRQAAAWFTNSWLFDALPLALGMDQPEVLNSDGEEIVFHDVVFPFAVGVTPKAVRTRLRAVKGLQAEGSETWTWTEPAQTAGSIPTEALRWNITTETGAIVLGSLTLKARTLTLSVNSAERAERGRALLQTALGTLVKPALTEIRTLDQAMADPRLESGGDDLAIPPEVERGLIHDIMDRQYRAVLHEPVPALGGISPCTAVKTAKGRTAVADWLKLLENRSGRGQKPGDPMSTYDFTWMWRELDVLHLRK